VATDRFVGVTVEPSISLAVVLGVLVALAVTVSWLGGLGRQRAIASASLRAVVQLAAVSAIIVAAIGQLWSSVLVVLVMFTVGVWTTTGRTGTRRRAGWAALAMAGGLLPVLALVFGAGAAPLNGYALIPIAGILTGNAMTAHTLTGRRLFDDLRAAQGTYDAGLSIGLLRSQAIGLITAPTAAEALVPALDQTRTVGLVTLPGAFIGVLLGGGTPLQAGAAQVLVLVGVLAAQSITIVTAHHFIRQARLLPDDLAKRLRP